MNTSIETPCTRPLTNEISINASAEAVWEAIATSEGLARWFPLKARVTPGAGGSVWFSWGADFEGESTIEIWEPGKRLRTRWGDENFAVVDDFSIESSGGTTTLRLVSQGFGKQASWDGQYDCVRKGWLFELNGLKNYIENHNGQDRQVAWVQRTAPAPLSMSDVWDRLLGGDGFAIDPQASELMRGADFSASDFGGKPFHGNVLVIEQASTLVASVDGPLPGLLRVELNAMGDDASTTIWVWLSTYGQDKANVESVQAHWKTKLEQMIS